MITKDTVLLIYAIYVLVCVGVMHFRDEWIDEVLKMEASRKLFVLSLIPITMFWGAINGAIEDLKEMLEYL